MRPDAPVEDRPRRQPGGPYPAAHSHRRTSCAAAPRPPCAARRRSSPAPLRRRFVHGRSRSSGSPRQVEASQLVERTDQDRGPLPTGGSIVGHAGASLGRKVLAGPRRRSHPAGMFVVTEADAAAIPPSTSSTASSREDCCCRPWQSVPSSRPAALGSSTLSPRSSASPMAG